MTGLTEEQHIFANHVSAAFVVACPGAGKTRTIVARIARIAPTLPPRQGIAVLSFTNSAIEEFIAQCHKSGVDDALRHPGFVSTFDGFLRQFFFLPSGIEAVATRPTVVDSWKTVGVKIRLRGPNAFRGDGVPLDLFDAQSNQITIASIGHAGLRAHVKSHLAAYQQSAAQRRRALRQNGYVSAADVRVDVLARLERQDRSSALGRALAARFKEIIIDEAQDCNPDDCKIINWLRGQRIPVTIVADPDQAIYGFRHGTPAELRAIENDFSTADQLSLTGNFRCSPPICSIAATLRSRTAPDDSIGETANVTEPVHLFAYPGTSVTDVIGRRFIDLMTSVGVAKTEGIVLAHARLNALRACGGGAAEESGSSKVATVARAVGSFWLSSASSRGREATLRNIERLILEFSGQIQDHETPARAAERQGIDRRWLRRTALELVSRVPRTCDNTDSARSTWVTALRAEVERLKLTAPAGMTIARFFPNRSGADWHQLLSGADAPNIRNTTIHEAKGRQYKAVCVVIPPDRGELRRTEHLLTCWENGTDDEAKRVIYVAITRAAMLAAIAIPATFRDRLIAILASRRSCFRLHNL